MRKPRILCFTGDGKGKTTAALGLGLRASGHGLKVKVIQFVKGDANTGEIESLKSIPGFQIIQTGKGFLPPETSPTFAEHREAARNGLKLAVQTLKNQECDVLILDEICVAVSSNMVEEKDVLNLLGLAGEDMVVVMTGRGATPGLVEAADTVTEMKCHKHCFDTGTRARRGVEF